MDAQACAAANADVWRAKADAAAIDSGCGDAFVSACADSGAGTDMTADKLQYVLDNRNVDAKVVMLTATHGHDDAWSRVYGGAWGPRREAVEVGVDLLGRAVYATLDFDEQVSNETYGEFRLVYGPDSSTLVLPHNSAQHYASTDGVLDEDAVCGDLAWWSSRGDLAVAERATEAASVPQSGWAHLVGGEQDDFDLIETISAGPLAATAVVAVRVRDSVAATAVDGFFTAQALGEAPTVLEAVFSTLLTDPELGPNVERITP